MRLINNLLDLYILILLARVILSWVRVGPYDNQVVDFIHKITEPVLEPVRRIIPPIGGNMDISPMVVMFGVYLIKNILF